MQRRRVLVPLIALTGLLATFAPAVAADPPGTVLVASDFLKYDGVSVSPGRVVWEGAHGVRKRGVGSDGSTVTVGTASTLGEGHLQPYGYVPHSSSGARTLWATEVGTSSLYTVKLTSGTRTKVIAQKSVPVRISGNRVLYKHQTGDHHYVLYDIHTGKTTDVTAKYNTRTSSYSFTVDLFGNYLVYTTKSFAIMRKNLSDDSKPVVVVQGGGWSYNGAFVVTYGDWVAWDRYVSTGDGFDNYDHCGLKNLRTMAPSTKTCVTNLTSAGSLKRGYDETDEVFTWKLRPYGSNSDTTLPVTTLGGTDLGVDGNVLAWGDAGGLHAAPLADAPPNPPRSLGNPVTSKTFTIGDTRWPFRLVTSAPLTKCHVHITQAGKLVRQLGCNPALLGSGEVLVRWNGYDDHGHKVQPGSYRWTAYASNDDGSMLRSDGVAKPTTGTLTVTH